jgi:hypothetical protein
MEMHCQMVDRDSSIKARYAMLVLKNARQAEREAAIKLLQSLASDFPSPNTTEKNAALQRAAVRACKQLLDSVRNSRETGAQWHDAILAARRWHDGLE